MAKLTVTLYGREYSVNCDPGQEQRLQEVIRFVEERMKEVEGNVGNTTEARLLMLTCLHMADEMIDLKNKIKETKQEEEEILIAAVDHLTQHVTHIASRIGRV
ncbi:MAG: cell division protein ZapA [Bdellovibrionales bacterium]